MTAQNLDSSERAVMVAATTDFYYCLYCPALTLYACPAVRRNFRLLQAGLLWFKLELETNLHEVFTITEEAPVRVMPRTSHLLCLCCLLILLTAAAGRVTATDWT